MSTQSMKYSDLPSIRQLMEFKRGELSGRERANIAGMVDNNPMVAAVMADLHEDQVTDIETISARIKRLKLSHYLRKNRFWWKWSGWFGLAVIVSAIGFYFWNASIQPEQRYAQVEAGLEVNNEPKKTKIAWNIEQNQQQEVKDDVAPEKAVNAADESGEESPQKSNVATTEINGSVSESEAPPAPEKSASEESKPEKHVDKKTATRKTTPDQETTEKQRSDKKREPMTATWKNEESSTRENESSTVVLSVNQVQILSKVNPKAMKTKQRNSDRNSLGAQTTAKNRQFSVKDMPQYPGGDRALKNYFVGQLKPIEIDRSADRYDRTALVELTINRWGKVKDAEIRGKLHPEHQKALNEAIEDLPRFKKGSERVHYSIGITF